jgi:hypothetical protein
LRVGYQNNSFTLKFANDRCKTGFLQHILAHSEIISALGIQLRLTKGELKFLIRKNNNVGIQGIVRIEATEIEIIESTKVEAN